MILSLSKTALSSLERISPPNQKRIIEKLKWFSNSENIFSFAKPIKNTKPITHRLRIGDYRALIHYSTKTDTLYIVNIGHRKDIYQKL